MMKVSVLVMTYNHEKFIREAIDSVLEQQTDFDFEIIISEDCSTDSTRSVVQEYKNKCPVKVRLLLSENNLRSNKIVARGIKAAAGEYIALLDGDDYWTSTKKLQKQSEFLDNNPDCAICFHNSLVIGDNNNPREWTPSTTPAVTTIQDLWFGNYIATSSTMFRNGLLKVIPDWYEDFFPITDWPLHLLNAEHGNIGFLNEVMSVYRLHPDGMYSPYSMSRKHEEILKFYNNINSCFNYKYHKIIKTAISKYFFEWADEYIKRNEYDKARICIKRFLCGKPVNRHIPILLIIKLLLKLYAFHYPAKMRLPMNKDHVNS